jgi:protocatechuate 3,4-dioxygenase beta subunit
MADPTPTCVTDNPRRNMLAALTALGAVASVPLLGCGGGNTAGGDSSSASNAGSSDSAGSTVSGCSVIPEEAAGPYPGDGSNSNASGVVNVLALAGVVRQDIRSSIGSASGTAAGVPLTVKLQLVNTSGACASLEGYAIYLWHCTREGGYSLYSSGVTGENFLRGVQATDASGVATFTTIFPGCYSGRMPHIHFEVYRNLASATGSTNKIKTSQLAFPVATCNEVYATSGYASSASNFARISFASDNIFSDGYATQLATLTGNSTEGYLATLVVGIAA